MASRTLFDVIWKPIPIDRICDPPISQNCVVNKLNEILMPATIPKCPKILDGVDDLIDEQLALILGPRFWKIGNVPHYEHRKTCLLIFKFFPANFDLRPLAYSIFARIAANYYRAGGIGASRSKENWRCTAELEIEEGNTSIEKQLEKQIAECFQPSWVNQIPVASGLTHPNSNKKNSIDLAWQPQVPKDSAVFVELKWNPKTNNPLFAALEVLIYGIIYLFARKDLAEFYEKKTLMKKNVILLNVLAPPPYYRRLPSKDRVNLERALDSSIRLLAQEQCPGLSMGFCFSEFPPNFEHPWQPEQLRAAMHEVEDSLRATLVSLKTP